MSARSGTTERASERGMIGVQLHKAAPSKRDNADQGPSQTLIGASDLMALSHHASTLATRTPQSDARTACSAGVA